MIPPHFPEFSPSTSSNVDFAPKLRSTSLSLEHGPGPGQIFGLEGLRSFPGTVPSGDDCYSSLLNMAVEIVHFPDGKWRCSILYKYIHIFIYICTHIYSCVSLPESMRGFEIMVHFLSQGMTSYLRFVGWTPKWAQDLRIYLVHTKILGTAGYLSHLLEHQIWMVLACFEPFPQRFIGFHWCVASMSDLDFAIVSTAHGWALELVVIRWVAPCSWCAWAHDNLQLRRPRHAWALWTPGPV